MVLNNCHLPDALLRLPVPFALTAEERILHQQNLPPVWPEEKPRPGASALAGDQRVYTLVSYPQLCLHLPRDCAEGESLFLLMDALLGKGWNPPPEWMAAAGMERFYRRLLLGTADPAEVSAFFEKNPGKRAVPHCVYLFSAHDSVSLDREMMTELLPLTPSDTLLQEPEGSVLCIHEMTSTDTCEDAEEFARACIETLSEDGGVECRAALGDLRVGLQDLPGALTEAREALRVGLAFDPRRSVYVYRKLALEQMIATLPPETLHACRRLLQDRQGKMLLDAETLASAEALFAKNLNIADAARQMFIHRNTMVYRIDKVQKLVGLDLRRFEDAAAFKVLLLALKRKE